MDEIVLTEETLDEYKNDHLNGLDLNFSTVEVARKFGHAVSNDEIRFENNLNVSIVPGYTFMYEFLEICGSKVYSLTFRYFADFTLDKETFVKIIGYTPNIKVLYFGNETGVKPEIFDVLMGVNTLPLLEVFQMDVQFLSDSFDKFLEWLQEFRITQVTAKFNDKESGRLVDILENTKLKVLRLERSILPMWKLQKLESIISNTFLIHVFFHSEMYNNRDTYAIIWRINKLCDNNKFIMKTRMTLRTLLLETDLDVNLVKGLVPYLNDRVTIVN